MPSDRGKPHNGGNALSGAQNMDTKAAHQILAAAVGEPRAAGRSGAVDAYYAGWSFGGHQGHVVLRVAAPTQSSWGFLATLKPETSEEMSVLLQLLASGQRLVFYELTQTLTSGEMPSLPTNG